MADLAQLLKHSEPVMSRGVTLSDLAARAAALEAQGVAGSAELARLIDLVARAH